MSYKIEKTTFTNKKVTPIEVNFETKNFMTSIIGNKNEELKNFKNILYGKYLVKSGSFKIDGFDKVNKDWTKQRVSLIGMNRYFRKWPEKFWLSTSLLLNKEFFNKAKIKYINNKYNYLSFLTTNNVKEDQTMRIKLEKMILTFIDSSIDIEEQWLKDFLNQAVEFNNKNLNEKNDKLDEHIKIIARDYFYLKEKTMNYELLETFLQSLWDKVYNFIELTSLCKCEYLSKKSKDKSIKKLSKHLNFHQVNYVVRKQLKIIDVKINFIRYKILSNLNTLKNLEKQINFELIKVGKITKKVKDLDTYFIWRKASLAHRSEFIIKQEKMFFEGLSDESTTLRGKIVEVVHSYHKLVLAKEIKLKKDSLYKEKLKELKNKIKSMSVQSREYINKLVDELGIKLDLFTIKWNKVINIWFQVLRSIFLGKHNIVFYKVLEKLTLSEIKELFHVLENLHELDKKYNFIFIDNKIQNVANLQDKFYLINNAKINDLSFSEFIRKNWSTYASEIFYNENKIPYRVEKDRVIILNNKVKTSSIKFKKEGYILLDPTKISCKKRENKNNLFELKGYVKDNNLFTDENIKYFISHDKSIKMYFYSREELKENQKISIYITEEAIFEIV
ncbi:hypothetical protein SCORR_v1c09650 [Spiroplasma corruscae]|uniref:Uncharacterized protein n=1 Tax=Spiroplasma corruscae TaxID=216934 RepID=A0A222EQF1_9MOLU|nr:hypothetical protein [Spiroplasma corruscae]ASP28737.1 hypothetical protein SCORR_v1c09650 [Spiroplasma corruscae]